MNTPQSYSYVPNGQKVNFSWEAEVYWPLALKNWLITRWRAWASYISFQNTWTEIVTLCPWYRGDSIINSQIVNEFAEPFAGIVIGPNGCWVFDAQSNSAIINAVRAVSHWGAAQLSIMAI